MSKKNKPVQKRKWWFRFMKKLMKGRYKKPEFVFLGEKLSNGGVVLSNHEGTDAPMSLEIYAEAPIRFWGAHEMNSGLVKMYKYQTRVYYHEKKGWNIHLARLFCLLATPLTNLFYKGLNLISTYRDARFIKTVNQSLEVIKQGDNIVIFPEDSSEGYKAELDGFYSGFAVFAEACLKKGIDLPIFVAYFQKQNLKYVFDAPVKYSELLKEYGDKKIIAKKLVERCNELGKM